MKNKEVNYWAEAIWLLQSATDVPTIHKNGGIGLWFSAVSQNGKIRINNARISKPSCNISSPIKITKEEFLKISAYYHPWLSGLIERGTVRDKTHKSSYIFGICNLIENR
jgi:hypothetical protein